MGGRAGRGRAGLGRRGQTDRQAGRQRDRDRTDKQANRNRKASRQADRQPRRQKPKGGGSETQRERNTGRASEGNAHQNGDYSTSMHEYRNETCDN